MSLFVRKIEYGKWIQNEILKGEQPSADAITNCMKTNRNTLSLWSIKDYNELEEAVLAIASQFDHIDSIDVLTIESLIFKETGLSLVNSEGLTPFKQFSNRHFDVIDLDYRSLGNMANAIIESIKKKRRKRFTRGNLIKILTNGVERGKVEWKDLKPDVQKKIPNKAPAQNLA